jgi:hypothetical protein
MLILLQKYLFGLLEEAPRSLERKQSVLEGGASRPLFPC